MKNKLSSIRVKVSDEKPKEIREELSFQQKLQK